MKKFPRLTLSLVAGLLAAAGFAAHAVEFRSADTHNADDYPTVAAVKYMSELLEKKSGGKHKIKVFNKQALGSEKETIDQPRDCASPATSTKACSRANWLPRRPAA